MRQFVALSIFILSFSAWANGSIQQHSETHRVFDALMSAEESQFPGLIEFRYGEDFYLPEFDNSECRQVPARGVLRLLTDYVDSLNEVGLGCFDILLFKKQMSKILGRGNYTRCISHSQHKGHERVDSFLVSYDGSYQLWLTEIYDD